jgi:quercetin dioxygenase-like cupin family protein
MDHLIFLDKLAAVEALKGAWLSSIQTEHFTVAYTNMKTGVEIPLHHHPEEAIDIVLEGELEMQIGNTKGNLTKDMISIVPSNVPHRAMAITDCKVVTIFYPKRNM